jgi:serine/threonine-protein kinase
MRELYGAEAEQVLSSVTTSGRLLEQKKHHAELYLSSGSGSDGLTATNPLGRRSPALRLGLGAVAVLVLAVGAAVTLLPGRGTTTTTTTPLPKPAPAEPAPALPEVDAGAGAAADEPARDPSADAAATEQPPPEQAKPLDAKARKRGAGTIDLRVTPWAEVYEGRHRIGLTPMAPFELPAGKHVLTLKNPQLGVTRQVTVKLAKGGRVTLKVDLTE